VQLAQPVERRTFVRYCGEEHVASDTIPMADRLATLVCDALCTNTTLVGLAVTGYLAPLNASLVHNFGDDEVAALSRSLVSNTTMLTLDLEANRITDRGALHLARALVRNRSLKKLQLKNNFISLRGMLALAGSLRHNAVIDELDVSRQLRDDGIRGLAPQNSVECTYVRQLIEDTLLRKAELLPSSSSSSSSSSSNGAVTLGSTFGSGGGHSSAAAVPFVGFASWPNLHAALEHLPSGTYVFYLSRKFANSLTLAIVRENGIATHHRVYRVGRGYSLRPSPYDDESELVRPASLFDTCAWTLCALSAERGVPLAELAPQLMASPDFADRLHKYQILMPLWGIGADVATDKPSKHVYSTLKKLATRNRDLLQYPLDPATCRRLMRLPLATASSSSSSAAPSPTSTAASPDRHQIAPTSSPIRNVPL